MFDPVVIVSVQHWERVVEEFSKTLMDPFERAAQSVEGCSCCGCSQKTTSCLHVIDLGGAFQAPALISVMVGRQCSGNVGRNDSSRAVDVTAGMRNGGTVLEDQNSPSCLGLNNQRMRQMRRLCAKHSSAAMLRLVNKAHYFAAS